MGKQRYVTHKVEALNPALWKTGTQEGRGASGATGYLLCPLDIGEEGMVWSVCVFRLLPDAPTSELTVEYEKEEG
jgi:hypothetical protein